MYQAQSNFSVVVDYINIWNITDPYAAYVQDAGGMLDSFGDHWNANFTDIPRDLTHLLTKRSNTGTGGIAWIDVLCNTNYRYGFSSNLTDDTTYTFPNPTYTWNLNVCAHEIGHNNDIELISIDERIVATIRFSGYANDTKVQRKKNELISTLDKYSIKHKNEFQLLVYDSPYKVLNRRNEVLVVLK